MAQKGTNLYARQWHILDKQKIPKSYLFLMCRADEDKRFCHLIKGSVMLE